MKALIEKAMVCEINSVPNKDGKVWPKMLVLETGKQYPKLLSLKIQPDECSKLNGTVGQVADIQIEAEEFSGKTGAYTVYTFLGFRKAA